VPAHASWERAPLRSLSPVFGGRSRARGPEPGAIGSARRTSVWVGKRALRARVTVEGPDQPSCLLSSRGGSSIRCRTVVDGASRSFCRGRRLSGSRLGQPVRARRARPALCCARCGAAGVGSVAEELTRAEAGLA
jgi:hypothetical protein